MTRLVWTLPDGESTARWATDEGGGSQPKIVTAEIAWDDPDLLTGKEIYTPAAGDVMPAWVGTLDDPESWNGTNPSLHFGSPGDLQAADQWITNTDDGTGFPLIPNTAQGAHITGLFNYFPFYGAIRFEDTTPLVISVDDRNGGDPGSTAGRCVLRFLIYPAS